MSFIGTIQSGPNADSYKQNAPTIFTVPASGVVNVGQPLRRNYLNPQGQNPGSQYAAVAGLGALAQGDQSAVLTSTAGGFLAGVYAGPAVATNNTGSSVATSVVTPYMVRTGVAPVLVGSTSGGTAVTIGSAVGMTSFAQANAIVGNGVAAGQNFGTVITQPVTVQGSVLGTVVGYPIVTALASAVTAGSGVTTAVSNNAGMYSAPTLTFNPGGSNAETIALTTSVIGTIARNDLTFGNASAGAAGAVTLTIGNASTGAIPGIPGGIIGVTLAMSTATTGANIATSLATLVNAAFSVYGAAPNNLPGVGGIQPMGIATAATSILSLAAAYPSPVFNAVAIGVSGAASSFASGGTSLGSTSAGTYSTIVATFNNNHVAGEPVVGTVQTSGATLTPVGSAGVANVTLALVDLIVTP